MLRLRWAGPLPAAIGRLVNQPGYAQLRERFPHALVVAALREQLAAERSADPVGEATRLALVEGRLREWTAPSLRRVINASGVVLHTNLGRAPLARSAVAAVGQVAEGYANLELELAGGKRGERTDHVAPLLRRLTGAPAALVVNNNAGAVLLMLTALGRGKDVIVSRGEQVEIGGAFRMPDVMRLSGARMIEVGTTNRTRAADYEEAITPRTAALLRVHTSNFRVTGFTESAALAELSEVAHRHGLLLLDDLGSGSLFGIAGEPSVVDSLKHADIVAFSGDKLLGGPQSGLLLGSAELVRKLAKHPLARALRVDKLSLAALEATLREWLLGHAPSLVPVERMLTLPAAELRRRAAWWIVKLGDREIAAELLDGESAAGGGSLPEQGLPTTLVALPGPASRLLRALREGEPPVLARISADRCCLDPRTVLPGEDEQLFDAVEGVLSLK
ncbi:MAG: L-seryl-tRNA(Sec) selenium transferase [Candidatus Dormibacteraeota bacterium]|nr:L-seryl-tRNA(Sec) selenium transferase [Candidatus Dormibacteraeota bacterium]